MKLAQLHTAGWQFGDIKTDNILVGAYGQTELVDYGGVTEHGHSVKQFTEMYDRGYWRCGARIADETYDLFSFAVLCIQLILPKNRAKEAFTVSPKQRNIGYLQQLLAEDKTLLPFHPFIIAALEGRFGSGAEALQAWNLIRWKNHEQRIVTKSGSPFRFVQALFISIMLCVLTMMFVFQY